MILRRVIANLRKQEWTAIGIDFVIVIVGVVIGLQVNEWAAAQADRRRGEAYVSRLVPDLQRDLAFRHTMTAYFDTVHASAERTNALLTEAAPNPTALVVNAYRATEFLDSRPRRAVWDEIVSTGDLGLLPAGAIDGGLAIYFGERDADIIRSTLRASPYRRRVRSLIPHDVQQAIRERCSDVTDESLAIVGFRQDCDLNLGNAQVAGAARALRQDPGVLSDLRYQFSDLAIVRAIVRRDIASIQGALAVLTAQ